MEPIREINSQRRWLGSQWLGPSLAAAVILAAGWLGLIRPQWQKWQAVRASDNALQQQLNDLNDYLNQLNSLQSQYLAQQRESISYFSRLQKLIPAQLNYAEIFYEFQQLVEGSGLVLTGLRISPANGSAAPPQSTALSLSVAGGNYPALKRILDVLEHNLRLTDILSLSFDAHIQSYTINARLYSLQ